MKKPLKWLIPLSAVAIVAVVAAVALILHLSNPDPIVYEPGTVIYQDDQVTAKVVEPAAQRQTISGYFSLPPEEEAFTRHPIIVTGTVRNIREVEISYVEPYIGPTSLYVTVFDFHVDEYLKNTSQTIGNKEVITVGWPSSSYAYDEYCPELHEGAEFLLFTLVTAEFGVEDLANRKAYAEAWALYACYLAFEKTDSGYTLNPRFEKYLTEDQKSKASANLVDIIKDKVAQYQEVG